MKAEDYASIRAGKHGFFSPLKPSSGKSPLVQAELRWDCIKPGAIRRASIHKRQVFGITDWGIWRLNVFVVGSSLCAAPAGVYKTTRSSAAISFLKELLDDLFTFLVLAFSELVITNMSGCIHDVIALPRAIVEGPPDGIVVVDGHRIGDLQVMHCFFNVGQVSFKGELRSMH